MRRLLLSLVICILGFVPYLQAQPDTMWTHAYGGSLDDYVNSVQTTLDGGFIVCGHTASYGNGGFDAWLIKLNSAGDTVWTRTYGGSGQDYARSVRLTIDNGYIIGGQTTSFGSGGMDVWLIKTDEDGNQLWSKTYGGSFYELGHIAQPTSDSGYVLCAHTLSYGAGGNDVWVIKVNAAGDTQWTRTYGGSIDDYGRSVIQTNDGGYLVLGQTKSFAIGDNDIWLIKIDAVGDTVWTRTYGGYTFDQAFAVEQTDDDGYIIAGHTELLSHGGYDVWLLKTDSAGDTIWTRRYGGTSHEYGYSARQTSDGGYVISGLTSSFGSGGYDVWLIKTDAIGDTLWTKAFGGSNDDHGYDVHQTVDEGYVIAGSTSSYGGGGDDAWVIRTTPDLSKIFSDDEENQIFDFHLSQNYPNPFNPTTQISWQLAVGSPVRLSIYDLLGREVTVLVNETQTAGFHQITFDAGNLASGIYFYQIETERFVHTRKMVLIK